MQREQDRLLNVDMAYEELKAYCIGVQSIQCKDPSQCGNVKMCKVTDSRRTQTMLCLKVAQLPKTVHILKSKMLLNSPLKER